MYCNISDLKMQGRQFLALALVLTFATIIAGCASTKRKSTESLLTWAGFKTVPANTIDREQMLNTLPPAKLSTVTKKGVKYYVYPDQKRRVFYVGKQTEYESYQDLAQDAQAMADSRSESDVKVHAQMITLLDWVD